MNASAKVEDSTNFQIFRECLSAVVLRRGQEERKKKGPKKRRTVAAKSRLDKVDSSDTVSQDDRESPEDVAEFIDYLAGEAFSNLPEELQTLSYSAVQSDAKLAERFNDPLSDESVETTILPIPATVQESLSTYRYIEPPKTDLASFMTPVLNSYVSEVTAAPPEWISTRTSACEICERDWIPLTYHHLIPRGIHAKVIKRGWHEDWMLNSVAWLCRACHSFVHRMASNEELARDYYTVEKILDRADVQSWSSWVGRVRWKTK